MAEVIQLNRDPKLNEFSKEDLVLNTITGDLFAKTSNKLFKIASRNTDTGLSTDDVLKLLLISVLLVWNETLGNLAELGNPIIVSFTALNPLGDNLGDNAPSSTADFTSTLINWEIFG